MSSDDISMLGLTYPDLELTITWSGGTIKHGTSDATPVLLIDTESSTVTWNYTVDVPDLGWMAVGITARVS
jgi:hypothetical protein